MTTSSNPRKFTIGLTEEQSGPFPVKTESIWFEETDSGYKVRNTPFFVDDLSFDDVVNLRVSDKGNYRIDGMVSKSGYSTIWIYFKNPEESHQYLAELRELGCGYEGGVLEDYYSVNVPPTVNFELVRNIIGDDVIPDSVLIDYPSFRHS